MLEPVDDNPFLAEFYSNPDRYAFPTQMFYMAARYGQQQALRQQDLFAPLVIADYLFEKDRLFAEMTLQTHELELYRRIVGLLPDIAPTPDLVVFLDAETDVIESRIRRRALGFEQKIPASYLNDLRQRYLDLWSRWHHAPVLHIRTDTLDYVNRPADRTWILSHIREALQGRAAGPLPGGLFAPRPKEI